MLDEIIIQPAGEQAIPAEAENVIVTPNFIYVSIPSTRRPTARDSGITIANRRMIYVEYDQDEFTDPTQIGDTFFNVSEKGFTLKVVGAAATTGRFDCSLLSDLDDPTLYSLHKDGQNLYAGFGTIEDKFPVHFFVFNQMFKPIGRVNTFSEEDPASSDHGFWVHTPNITWQRYVDGRIADRVTASNAPWMSNYAMLTTLFGQITSSNEEENDPANKWRQGNRPLVEFHAEDAPALRRYFCAEGLVIAMLHDASLWYVDASGCRQITQGRETSYQAAVMREVHCSDNGIGDPYALCNSALHVFRNHKLIFAGFPIPAKDISTMCVAAENVFALGIDSTLYHFKIT